MFRLLFVIIVLLSNLAAASDFENKIVKNSVFEAGPYDFVYGQADAPVQILEYFSLSCPHCENFYSNIFPKLKKNYIDTGKVMWIKRSYVTDAASSSGTMLLYCVGKEKYEAYLSILLTKQASWAYQKDFIDRLRNIAGLGGMKADKFNACMKDKKIDKHLRDVVKEAKVSLKISGSPSFYINKNKADVYTYKAFTKMIDEELAGKS